MPSRLCVLCILMFVYYYTVCYFTCIFYAVVRQMSMLFIDNKDSVFCILNLIILIAPRRNPANRVGLDKALMDENIME